MRYSEAGTFRAPFELARIEQMLVFLAGERAEEAQLGSPRVQAFHAWMGCRQDDPAPTPEEVTEVAEVGGRIGHVLNHRHGGHSVVLGLVGHLARKAVQWMTAPGNGEGVLVDVHAQILLRRHPSGQ